MALVDFFDPNIWQPDLHEYRVYADDYANDYANDYAVVDQIDYQYLIQWRWKLKKSRITPNTKKPKIYLVRTGHEGGREDRLCSTIFLHAIVMERKGTPQPKTNEKLIIDHANSDGFDCRRDNLRWATISFNRRNRDGSLERVFDFEENCI
jgi:hypothetical protein